MKRNFLLLIVCLVFTSCSKDKEPEQRTYDFAGRSYERYTSYTFTPGKRTYYAIEFLNDTTVLTYSGKDNMNSDSVWYRVDTAAHSIKSYLYRINDCSYWLSGDYPPLGYIAEIWFYRRETSEIHGDQYEAEHFYDVYEVKEDESRIWKKDTYQDYIRVR